MHTLQWVTWAYKTRIRIKANKDQDFCFCESFGKSRLEYLNRGMFYFLVSKFMKGLQCTLQVCCGQEDYLERLLAKRHVVLCTSRICRDACLEQRIASVTSGRRNGSSWNTEVSVPDQPIGEFNAMKRKVFFFSRSFRFY